VLRRRSAAVALACAVVVCGCTTSAHGDAPVPTAAPVPKAAPGSTRVSASAATAPTDSLGHSPDIPPSEPVAPGGLAVAADSDLYVADQTLDVIFKRSAAGIFTVFAGDGSAGYSGDGGPAMSTEIDYPAGMIVETDGTLLFADEMNNRIRAVSPSGIITTVAGNGGAGRVTSSGRATAEPVDDPSDVDLDPAGGFDITASAQLLHVDIAGNLTVLGGTSTLQGLAGIGGPALTGSLDGPDGVARASNGGIFVSGFNTKALLYITPAGLLEALDQSCYARGSGGLRRAPDGSVVAMDDETIERYRGTVASSVYNFGTSAGVQGDGFQPNGLAVAPDGSIWVSTDASNGWATAPALARIDPTGHVVLAWRGLAQ
jgi:sugar lactone lactonase YvrE